MIDDVMRPQEKFPQWRRQQQWRRAATLSCAFLVGAMAAFSVSYAAFLWRLR